MTNEKRTRNICVATVIFIITSIYLDLSTMFEINYFGNILVLPEVSQIIPLFLMDCKLKQKNEQLSHSFWYPSGQRLQFDSSPKEKKPIYIAKQILRVVLKHINNRMRKYQRYQIRQFS